MLMVLINGNPVDINQDIPTSVRVSTLEIINVGGPKMVPTNFAKDTAKWIFNLVQRTEGDIIYNTAIVDKRFIKPYKWEK